MCTQSPVNTKGRHEPESGVVIVLDPDAGNQRQTVRDQRNFVLYESTEKLRAKVGRVKGKQEVAVGGGGRIAVASSPDDVLAGTPPKVVREINVERVSRFAQDVVATVTVEGYLQRGV